VTNILSTINPTNISRLASSQLLNAASSTSIGRALLSTIPLAEQAIWGRTQSPPVPQQFAANVNSPAASAVDPKTLSRLSADVYENRMGADGFRAATLAEMSTLGIGPSDLNSTRSAFRAQVYVRNTNGTQEYVVAFRGSTSHQSDWKANAQQALGQPTDHYAKALNIGQLIARSGAHNVTITGHSLGGGLASAAAVAAGRPAVTFNAAGLHENTIQKANTIRNNEGVRGVADVSAFYVRGEILSAMQDGGDRVVGGLIGRALAGPFGGFAGAFTDAPEAYGKRVALDPVRPQGTAWYQDNTVARHGMDWVQASMDRR
jgi:pimeloyl-ACP methyl ester carboxylesterase